MSPSVFNDRVFIGPFLLRSCVNNHSYCELKRATATSQYLELSFHASSPSSNSYILSFSSAMIHEGCSRLIFVAVINIMMKINLGKNRVWFTYTPRSITETRQSRTSNRNSGRTVVPGFLLHVTQGLVQLTFLYSSDPPA